MKKNLQNTKRWKRKLVIATAVALTVTSVPLSVFAEGEETETSAQAAMDAKAAVTDIDNPLHWYKFDGEESLKDYGSNPIDGTVIGNVSYADGKTGQAASFTTSNGGAIKVADSEFKNLGDYSISAWINWDGSLSASNTILRSDDGYFWFHVRKQDGNDRKLWVDYPDGNVNSGNLLVPENEWVHVVFVNDSETGTKLYMNGDLIGESSTPAPWRADGSGFTISREAWHVFNGEIDDVRMYDGTLSEDQVAKLYGILKSSVKTEEIKIKQENWGTEDVDISMDLAEGDTLAQISNGDAQLTEGTDYTINGSTVSIKAEYLASEAVKDENSVRLTFRFAGGASDTVTLIQVKPYEEVVYKNSFETLDGLQQVGGDGEYYLEEPGVLRITGEVTLIDTNAPELTNGEVEFTFEPMNDGGGMGALFHANEADRTWSGIQCVDSRTSWAYAGYNLKSSTGTDQRVWSDPLIPLSDRTYRMKIRFEDNKYTFWLDGQEATTFTSDALKNSAASGKAGLFTMSKADVRITDLEYRSFLPVEAEEAADAGQITLTSDEMSVTLDGAFPRVLEYDYNGSKMYGQAEPKYYAMINGENYRATAEVTGKTEDSVTYRVNVADVETAFDTTYTIKDNTLSMELSNIDESNVTVYTLGFPENSMISVKADQKNPKMAAAVPNKRLYGDEVEDVSDKYYDLTKAIDSATYQYANIPFLYTDEVAASMHNNLDNNLQEFCYQSFTTAEGETYTGVWNNEFVHRIWGFDKVEARDDLSCVVMLTGDANGDETVDWQDGALALNDVRGLLPGAEELQDSFVHIAMNFASGAQNPFLRIADNMKRMYLNTDGFNQMLEIKGYNSEGHDSGHAESSDVNMRAGGAEDFQILCEEMKNYGALIGGHVNLSNMFPEAEVWKPEFVTKGFSHEWGGWLDDGCDIKRENYMSSGEAEAQLNALAESVPDIGLTYLDTYNDFRSSTYVAGQNFLSHGWAIWTENKAALDKYATWTHWPGVSSTIHRFVHHQDKDTYGGNNLLWGGYGRSSGDSFMSWQHNSNIQPVLENFFREQLPYRYLMNHELLKMTSTDAYFEGNVHTTSDKKIYKDDKLIADGNSNLIFVPWFDEDSETGDPDEAAKIYHWNNNGGTSTWELPDSWSNVSTVKVYRLDDTGKNDETIVDVEDGKVTINAKSKTPYVIYKGEGKNAEIKVDEWSTGSEVKDASFMSHTFDEWTVEGDAEMSIEHTSTEKCYLNIPGTEDGEVSQEITLVPGQKYELSVWAEVDSKQAIIEITLPNGEKVSNYMDNSPLAVHDINSLLRYTNFMRMGVIFTMPEGEETTAIVTLKGVGGERESSYAAFTDVRIVETAREDLPEGYLVNEDFENVSEGYGPFFNTSDNEKTHLSEANEPYTSDTLDGKWSLKCKGNGVRTLPHTVRFEPNTVYTIEFLSSGGGTIRVRCDSSSEELLNASILEGTNTFQIVTGDADDYYVQLDSPQIIDNFVVKEAVVDRAALEGLIEDAKTAFTESDYTAEQWNTYQREIARAQVALDKDNADEEDFEEAFRQLRQAMTALSNSGGIDAERDLPIDGMTATAASEEIVSEDNKVSNALDNNSNTFWHTDWDGEALEDLWIDIALAEPETVGGVRILSRPGGGNGTINSAEIWVKTADSDEYVKIVDNASFGVGWNKVTFEEVENVTNVKIQPLETQGGNKFASAAEIRIMGGMEEAEPPVVDKSALQETVNAAKALDKADYMGTSWAVLEEKLAAAEAALANESATDYDVLLAEANLKNAMETLVEAADKEQLNALIAYAQAQKEAPEYQYVVPAVKTLFENALAKAEEVTADADAEQTAVDAAYDNLLAKVHLLAYTGDSSELKVLVDVVKGMDLTRYTEDTAKAVEAALETAEEVLANENALQKEIDEAKEALQAAVDALEKIPVDKSKLEKLVQDSQKYADAIDKYTPVTGEAFTAAFEGAKAVLADEDATQEMVDSAYGSLLNAVFNLREIPDKSKLEELIEEAEGIDLTAYTSESAERLNVALMSARAVFADVNATAAQVASAEEALSEAIDGLEPADTDEPGKDDGDDTDDGNGSGGSTGGTNDGNGSGQTTGGQDQKAAKTGDASSALPWAAAAVLSLSALAAILRKKYCH